MSIAMLSGKIQTVLAAIEPDQLGITLPHEHLVSDGSAWFVEPSEASRMRMAHGKVSLETLWWIRYNWFGNLDDLMCLDEQEAIEELVHFVRAGGRSVIEMSNNGLGRDPLALARISRATGLNIVMGSGYYVAASLPADFTRKPQEVITEEIIRDLSEADYLEQILISQDIWNKHQRRRYGGWGYDHILRNVVPVMKAKGMRQEEIDTIMIENPRRLLTFP